MGNGQNKKKVLCCRVAQLKTDTENLRARLGDLSSGIHEFGLDTNSEAVDGMIEELADIGILLGGIASKIDRCILR